MRLHEANETPRRLLVDWPRPVGTGHRVHADGSRTRPVPDARKVGRPMLWVIVLIGLDGTVAVVGSRNGRPFRSLDVAKATARRWDDGGRQVEVVTIDNGEDV
jgi:hypothetical protein